VLTRDGYAHVAAEEYINAADEVRLIWQCLVAVHGPDAALHDPIDPRHQPVWWRRLVEADERCRELGLWTERTWELPRHLANRTWYTRLADGRYLQLVRVRTGAHESRFQHWLQTRRVAA
jgi:hypothetical protein